MSEQSTITDNSSSPHLGDGGVHGGIVFMGTPDFAVASLKAVVEAGYNVVGVVTAPDKPAGRGWKLQESAVKKYASEQGLAILQPEKLKAPEFLQQLRSLNADLQVVVAFRMLPEVVWAMPPHGTVNVHGSLLPQYRGAAPINWAIINGEKETGITTFKLQHQIDTGNILLQESLPIGDHETAGELHDRMMHLGAEVLLKTLEGIAAGTLTEQPQAMLEPATGGDLKHAPKIFTETCKIDWSRPAAVVHNLIRGLSPFPRAFTMQDGKTLKIYRSRIDTSTELIAPGQPLSDGKTFLKFGCADGAVDVLELQLEGKKRMSAADFLRGYKLGSTAV